MVGTFAKRSVIVLRYSALLRRRSGERPGLGALHVASTVSADWPRSTAGPATMPIAPAVPVPPGPPVPALPAPGPPVVDEAAPPPPMRPVHAEAASAAARHGPRRRPRGLREQSIWSVLSLLGEASISLTGRRVTTILLVVSRGRAGSRNEQKRSCGRGGTPRRVTFRATVAGFWRERARRRRRRARSPRRRRRSRPPSRRARDRTRPSPSRPLASSPCAAPCARGSAASSHPWPLC